MLSIGTVSQVQITNVPAIILSGVTIGWTHASYPAPPPPREIRRKKSMRCCVMCLAVYVGFAPPPFFPLWPMIYHSLYCNMWVCLICNVHVCASFVQFHLLQWLAQAQQQQKFIKKKTMAVCTMYVHLELHQDQVIYQVVRCRTSEMLAPERSQFEWTPHEFSHFRCQLIFVSEYKLQKMKEKWCLSEIHVMYKYTTIALK